MSSETTARRGRGRRPLSEVRADVLNAAGELLFKDGYSGFTIEKVIALSGVSSATIYKYWPSRGALALDGYRYLMRDTMPVADSGDVAEDIGRIMAAFVETMTNNEAGKILPQLIGAAQTDAGLADQFENYYFGPRRGEVFALLSKAQDRRQIRQDADLGLLVDLIWGACYVRLLLPHLTEQLTTRFAHDVVQTVLSTALLPE